jgi:predicted lipoprotein with Yx(FWY)xxD motif
MRPSNRLISLAGVATAALLIAAACTSAAATPAASALGAQTTPAAPSASQAPTSQAPTSHAPTSQALTSFPIGVTNDPTLGAYLTGQNGMTLYIFKNDTPDTSSCTGTCATNWPALTVAGGTAITGPTGAVGTFSLITRPEGTMQVAYDHQPLYYYAGDSAAGDTTGEGFSGKWYVAPLTAGAASATTSAPASAATSQSGYK